MFWKPKSRRSTLSSKTLGYTLGGDALGLHINTSIEPAVAASYGLVRNHSYTSNGVYQTWCGIEPTTKGTRDWTALDTWVNTHFAAGRKIILDLSGSPNWAVSAAAVGGSPYPNTKGNMPPDNWSDWGDFITAAATRYAGKIYAYDGWNEPNLSKYFAGSAATAAKLAAGQKVLYQAVKAADPAALVLSPPFTSVFSGVDGSGSGAVGLKQFLTASDGASGTGADWFDHIAYHFYCNDSALRPTGLERMYRECRAALDAAGRSNAQIWAGETGVIVPGMLSLPLAQQQSLMRCFVLTLFALGVRRLLWFSVDAADIGWGVGSDRAAMAATWNGLYSSLVGRTLVSAKVYTTDQSTLTAEIVTDTGTLSASVSGMPQ